jgi:hypothetical protein
MKFKIVFLCLIGFWVSNGFSQPKSKGDIYINDKRVFVQKDDYVLKDGVMTKSMTYDDLNGHTIIRTKVTYDPNTLAFYDFSQEDFRTGQLEVISHKGNSFDIKYKKDKKSSVDQKVLTESSFILSGALMFNYLYKNLDRLNKGEELTFDFPAASMQRFVSFSAIKVEDKIINGVAHTAIKLYISTWVLRMLVDPMYFYFEKTGAKRVKQYEGRLTPSDEKGNPLVGKVVFSYEF